MLEKELLMAMAGLQSDAGGDGDGRARRHGPSAPGTELFRSSERGVNLCGGPILVAAQDDGADGGANPSGLLDLAAAMPFTKTQEKKDPIRERGEEHHQA